MTNPSKPSPGAFSSGRPAARRPRSSSGGSATAPPPANGSSVSSAPAAPAVGDTSGRRSRVYLIAQPSIRSDGSSPDLRDLGRFGEVRVLVHGNESPARHPQRVMDAMESRFTDFDPALDYLVWAGGDTLGAVMLGYLLADFDVTQIKWLRWGNPRDPDNPSQRLPGRYLPHLVPFLPESQYTPPAGDADED